MYAWEAIQKTLDYIENNLSKKITPKELAEIAGLSPFYFQRLFTRLVNRPVSEYIKMRRLAELTTSALDKAMKYLFGTWLPNHKLVTQPFSVEKYYKTTKDTSYMEIWVIPVPIKNIEE